MGRPGASYRVMKLEQTPPNQPKFVLVVYMAAFAIVVIVLAFIIVISWRNRKGHKTPYTKTPTSQLTTPAMPPSVHGTYYVLTADRDAA